MKSLWSELLETLTAALDDHLYVKDRVHAFPLYSVFTSNIYFQLDL